MATDYRGVFTPDNIDPSIKSALPQKVLKNPEIFNFDLLTGVSPEHGTGLKRLLANAVRVGFALYQANRFTREMSYWYASHYQTITEYVSSESTEKVYGAAEYFRRFSNTLYELTQVWKNNIRDFYYPMWELADETTGLDGTSPERLGEDSGVLEPGEE